MELLRNDKRNLSTEKKKKKTFNHQMIFLFI